MREAKFRYVLEVANSSPDDPAYYKWIETKIFTLEEVECGKFQEWIEKEGYYDVRVVAKNQYTDLKDKSRKEIYEGDIIEIDDDWKSGEGERGEVMWDGKNAMFRLFCYTKYGGEGWFMPENKTWTKLKIIGNICENPELLKEED